MKHLILLAITLCASAATPALTQTAPAPALVANPSPEAVSAARNVAAKLFPPGTYRQIMGATMDAIMGNMGDMMKSVPIKEIAQLGGAKPEEIEALSKVNLEEIMTIYDPLWKERQQRGMRAMMAAMSDFFTTLEPDMREALAQAFAHRFTTAELIDLDHYFGTPTGTKFATGYMTMMTDPAMMDAMKSMMPKMMQQMPRFIEAAQKATADMPPPRKMQDLTPAERARLAKALGIDENKLQDPKSRT